MVQDGVMRRSEEMRGGDEAEFGLGTTIRSGMSAAVVWDILLRSCDSWKGRVSKVENLVAEYLEVLVWKCWSTECHPQADQLQRTVRSWMIV